MSQVSMSTHSKPHSLYKAAGIDPQLAAVAYADAGAKQQQISDAVGTLGRYLAYGALLGAGGRLAIGLPGMLRRPSAPTDIKSSVPEVLRIRLPKPQQAKKESADSWAQWGAQTVNSPYGVPLGLALGGTTAYGSWQLVNNMLKERKKLQLSAMVGRARKEYEKEVKRQMFDLAQPESRLAKAATALFEKCGGNPLDVAGAALLSLGLAAALGSGVASYRWASKRDQGALLEKALARRGRLRSQAQPIIAIPQYQ